MIVRFTKTLTLVLALGVLVVLLTSAFLAGAGNTDRIRAESFAAGYAQGMTVAGAPAASPSPASATPASRSIVGIITATSADGLSVQEDAMPGSAAPRSPTSFVLAKNATIIDLSPKDPATLQQELDAYNRRLRANPASTEAPPAPDTETPLALTDLAAGDRVAVQTSSKAGTDPLVADGIVRTARAAR